MDIKEVQEKKRQAEGIITKVLQALEQEAGLEIVKVAFERSEIVRGFSTPDIEKTKITLLI